MALLTNLLKQTSRIVRLPLTQVHHARCALHDTTKTCSPLGTLARWYSTGYKPYQEYDTSSPYRKPKAYRHEYEYKFYKGGVLPRPKGAFEDKPLPMPQYKRKDKDNWVERKALFGQNDYIDILGDGTIHPYQLIKAPLYLKAFKGNEMQRLIQRLKFEGSYLKEHRPKLYTDIKKRIWYLYKKFNHGRHTNKHWSRGKRMKSRIDTRETKW